MFLYCVHELHLSEEAARKRKAEAHRFVNVDRPRPGAAGREAFSKVLVQLINQSG